MIFVFQKIYILNLLKFIRQATSTFNENIKWELNKNESQEDTFQNKRTSCEDQSHKCKEYTKLKINLIKKIYLRFLFKRSYKAIFYA